MDADSTLGISHPGVTHMQSLRAVLPTLRAARFIHASSSRDKAVRPASTVLSHWKTDAPVNAALLTASEEFTPADAMNETAGLVDQLAAEGKNYPMPCMGKGTAELIACITLQRQSEKWLKRPKPVAHAVATVLSNTSLLEQAL